eukprot:1778224-Lingulodinium_polyedra.AAC.1
MISPPPVRNVFVVARRFTLVAQVPLHPSTLPISCKQTGCQRKMSSGKKWPHQQSASIFASGQTHQCLWQ